MQVIIAGKTVVEGGEVLGIDRERVVSDFNQMVREKFSR
jgi:hypothetical protein